MYPREATSAEHLLVQAALNCAEDFRLKNQITLEPFSRDADLVAHVVNTDEGGILHAFDMDDRERIQRGFDENALDRGQYEITPVPCPLCRAARGFFRSTYEQREQAVGGRLQGLEVFLVF